MIAPVFSSVLNGYPVPGTGCQAEEGEKTMNDTIGVDISKPTIDTFRLTPPEQRQFPNDRAGCAALTGWVGKPAARVVFEPTSACHRLFEATLVAAGVEAVKVNPRAARRFAEATGRLAKTDRIDAAILARMGAVLDLEGRPAKSETLHDLGESSVARQALIKDRIAATNRAQIAVNPVIRRQFRARLKQIGTQLKEIDAAIATLVASDPELSRRRNILASIPGLNPWRRSCYGHGHPDRNARDWRVGQQTGGQPRRARPDDTPIRQLVGPRSHQRGTAWSAQCALHASPGGAAFQPRSKTEVSTRNIHRPADLGAKVLLSGGSSTS